jgi:hypothetical protein
MTGPQDGWMALAHCAIGAQQVMHGAVKTPRPVMLTPKAADEGGNIGVCEEGNAFRVARAFQPPAQELTGAVD